MKNIFRWVRKKPRRKTLSAFGRPLFAQERGACREEKPTFQLTSSHLGRSIPVPKSSTVPRSSDLI